MQTVSVDKEMMNYWQQLTMVQKESLLSVVKSFVETAETVNMAQYNQEIDEAVKRVEAGEFYTQAEVEAMAKNW